MEIRNIIPIFDCGELLRAATSSVLELLQPEGNRMVKRTVELFNLDVIISDGKGSKGLEKISVVKDSLTTATDGKNYLVKYYNLDVIISVGYRVKSIIGTKRPAITKHLRNIYAEGELIEQGTCSILEHMGNDSKQRYETRYYNLDAILSVGYRVNSKNATQFRRWANSILKEYLLKGYSVLFGTPVRQSS